MKLLAILLLRGYFNTSAKLNEFFEGKSGSIITTTFPQSKSAHFFLICRRARHQRLQSAVLGTLRIHKHFELYNELKTKQKTKESQLAFQVMKPRSRFLLTAQSAERKEASFTIQLLNSIITQDCNKKANEDPAMSCAKFALVEEPSTASSHNDNICGRLPVQHFIAASIPAKSSL